MIAKRFFKEIGFCADIFIKLMQFPRDFDHPSVVFLPFFGTKSSPSAFV
jgi:hypothetical protein